VVRDRRPVDAELDDLPDVIRIALTNIKSDSANWASDPYYFPFFANYAVQLRQSLLRMAANLSGQADVVLFIRDTVRSLISGRCACGVRAVRWRMVCSPCSAPAHRSKLRRASPPRRVWPLWIGTARVVVDL